MLISERLNLPTKEENPKMFALNQRIDEINAAGYEYVGTETINLALDPFVIGETAYSEDYIRSVGGIDYNVATFRNENGDVRYCIYDEDYNIIKKPLSKLKYYDKITRETDDHKLYKKVEEEVTPTFENLGLGYTTEEVITVLGGALYSGVVSYENAGQRLKDDIDKFIDDVIYHRTTEEPYYNFGNHMNSTYVSKENKIKTIAKISPLLNYNYGVDYSFICDTSSITMRMIKDIAKEKLERGELDNISIESAEWLGIEQIILKKLAKEGNEEKLRNFFRRDNIFEMDGKLYVTPKPYPISLTNMLVKKILEEPDNIKYELINQKLLKHLTKMRLFNPELQNNQLIMKVLNDYIDIKTKNDLDIVTLYSQPDFLKMYENGKSLEEINQELLNDEVDIVYTQENAFYRSKLLEHGFKNQTTINKMLMDGRNPYINYEDFKTILNNIPKDSIDKLEELIDKVDSKSTGAIMHLLKEKVGIKQLLKIEDLLKSNAFEKCEDVYECYIEMKKEIVKAYHFKNEEMLLTKASKGLYVASYARFGLNDLMDIIENHDKWRNTAIECFYNEINKNEITCDVDKDVKDYIVNFFVSKYEQCKINDYDTYNIIPICKAVQIYKNIYDKFPDEEKMLKLFKYENRHELKYINNENLNLEDIISITNTLNDINIKKQYTNQRYYMKDILEITKDKEFIEAFKNYCDNINKNPNEESIRFLSAIISEKLGLKCEEYITNVSNVSYKELFDRSMKGDKVKLPEIVEMYTAFEHAVNNFVHYKSHDSKMGGHSYTAWTDYYRCYYENVNGEIVDLSYGSFDRRGDREYDGEKLPKDYKKPDNIKYSKPDDYCLMKIFANELVKSNSIARDLRDETDIFKLFMKLHNGKVTAQQLEEICACEKNEAFLEQNIFNYGEAELVVNLRKCLETARTPEKIEIDQDTILGNDKPNGTPEQNVPVFEKSLESYVI